MRLVARTELRTRVIGVTGPKGSPGCTFLAVGLARCLAEHGLPTLLIDADSEGGAVSAMLDLPRRGAAALGRAAALGLDPQVLREASQPAGQRLWCLEPVIDGDGLDGRELTHAARLLHRAIVLDLGHSLGRFQRQLAATADAMLWVVVPDRLGLDRADQSLTHGSATGAGRGLVVNRRSRWSLAGAERVLMERHRLPVVARFPEHRRAARRVCDGAPAHRQRAFQAGLERVARTVHPDLDAGGVWP